MHRALLIISLSLWGFSDAWSQTAERSWIFFKDKSGAVPNDARALGITERALQRRAKVLPSDRLLDEADLPVSTTYLNALTSAGIKVRSVSRWLNAASVDAPAAEQRSALRSFPFVSHLQPVLRSRRRPLAPSPLPSIPLFKSTRSAALSYGSSEVQNTTIDADSLHNIGVIGAGVFVGMLDDGFNYHREHPALSPIRVVAEYDFIQSDSNTSVQPGEFATQGYHGSATLGTLAGDHPDSLIGPAFGATLALGKTEIDSVEIVQEEDNYVLGLEWLEGLGVDIISTSLGYVDWYPSYSSFDGNTAITTKAARILARKGVLLVTAMGNERHLRADSAITGTLIAPADADSIVSVGAISSNGLIATFSSTGPTYDGRMKPEVAAQGIAVFAPPGTSASGYNSWQGTSFATPLTAAVAALILSAHPDATPMQIRSALMSTADQTSDGTTRTEVWPNPYYGYGRVRAAAAALSLGPIISNLPIVHYFILNDTSTLVVSLRALSNDTLDTDKFKLYYRRRSETTFSQAPFVPSGTPGLYSASIVVTGPADTSYVGYVTYGDRSGPVLRRPVGSATFDLSPSSDSVTSLFPPGASPSIPAGYALASNYPNPFNAGTTFAFTASQRGVVRLDVFDLLGRHLRTIFEGQAVPGENLIPWNDVRDEDGNPLASGVYLFRLTTPQNMLAGTMVLLK